MSKHIVKDVEFVICPYCDKVFYSCIQSGHLKKHNKSINDIITEFPNNPTCTKSFIDKQKDNRLKSLKNKYGDNITNISQVKKFKEKISDGIKKSSEISISKRKRTISQKIETNSNYYNEITHKCKKTKAKNHNGDSNYNNIDRMKKTKKEKYGDEYFTNQSKREDTNLKKYNYISPTMNPNISSKISETRNKNMSNNVIKFLDDIGIKLEGDYINSHYKHKFTCLKCGTSFTKIWNEIQQGYTCPICYPRYINSKSVPQKEIEEYLNNIGIETTSNNRLIIKPYELDIVSKNEKIAIEFCGLAYHNEDIINETRKIDARIYHLFKLEECIKNGYRLITIFEDEWFMKRNIVKDRLKYIFGKYDGLKIHARKCEIREISPNEKNVFLDNYHIQGRDTSNVKLGAFYNNELVSVMTFSHGNISKGQKEQKDNIWELNRFCTNSLYSIPGIASKLLEHFKRNYEWNIIFSYADRRWSDGRVYDVLGFKFDGYTAPNYWYINLNKGIKRIHRFYLRKRHDEPKDEPEWMIRRKEGYIRIWDCGNLKYIMNNEKK